MATQKKSKIASERDEGARALWRWLVSRFDVRRLVFVDESGTHISMDRLRSRAPRGARAYGKVPRNRGKKQRQEPDADRLDEPVWDGRVDVH